MNRYNKLKQKTLAFFSEADGEWLKPDEVARGLDFWPRRSAWTYLKRLSKFGLLEKRERGRGTLEYRISEAGEVRLRWLRSRRA
jgi:DNA-binding IclR family transcriptional regulator